MSRTLNGRRIVLTGASGAIGRVVASQLADAGAKLVLAARSADTLNEMARTFSARGVESLAVTGDLCIPADRERLIAAAVERFGGIDVLINNAGLSSWIHFSRSDEESLRTLMEVNFFAPTELIRLALPHLTEGNEPAIVNISSICGRVALPAFADYSATKFALSGITEALRGEMARFGIDVILVVPGKVRVDRSRHMLRMEGKAKLDFDKGIAPEQVATAIVRALQKGKRETVIAPFPQRFLIRLRRWWPSLVDWGLSRKVRKLYAGEEATKAPAAVGN
jgi:short-subunit dehydrogenase